MSENASKKGKRVCSPCMIMGSLVMAGIVYGIFRGVAALLR